MIRLLNGDCIEVLAGMAPESIDACVTDPPYHLASIVKRFGTDGAAPARGNDAYERASRGFMGKTWDGGDVAFRPETWAAVLRVLKPGAHLVAFGAPKNYHRLACAIEDAGFEIRDSLMWLFGSGFPKSHNLDGDREGWGTALKPAYEPIILARKPLIGTVAQNVMKHGTGAIHIDATRVGDGEVRRSMTGGMARKANPVYGAFANTSVEPITTTDGRWPANVVHDGSDEVLAGFPSSKDGVAGKRTGTSKIAAAGLGGYDHEWGGYGGSGSAARFFYCAKASAKDRAGSKHPTVKPIALMRWLCRLVTPPGGLILDPFAGTGTTGQAAQEEGFSAVLIEREAEYQADIRRRLGLTTLPAEIEEALA